MEDKVENCGHAIDACLEALSIYSGNAQSDYADIQKNLGYTYVTLAEMKDKAENCKKATQAYKTALEFYSSERDPLEHADILRDLGYAYVTLSDVEDKEESCRKAIKVYKKAFKAYSDLAGQLAAEGDPRALEVRDGADRCHRSMEACKRVIKTCKRSQRA